MNTVSITADCMGICIVLIVLHGQFGEIHEKNALNRSYNIFVSTLFGSLIVDVVSWLTILPRWIVVLSCCLSCWCGILISTTYILYIYYNIAEVCDISPKYTWAVYAILVSGTFIDFSLEYSGLMFTLTDGVFYIGELYYLGVTLNYSPVVIGIMMLWKWHKQIGSHGTMALASFVVIPVVASSCQWVVPNADLVFASCSVAVLLMYVVIQTKTLNESHMREKIMREISHTDALTKLPNRLYYMETMEQCKNQQTVGVIFCDLNYLKQVNDTQGHEGGDRLICDFADLLRGIFNEEKIFRTGGDEYVVLLENISEEDFAQKNQQLHTVVAEKKQIASLGDAYGDGKNIVQLVNTAETNMYAEKAVYHAKHPRE